MANSKMLDKVKAIYEKLPAEETKLKQEAEVIIHAVENGGEHLLDKVHILQHWVKNAETKVVTTAEKVKSDV